MMEGVDTDYLQDADLATEKNSKAQTRKRH